MCGQRPEERTINAAAECQLLQCLAAAADVRSWGLHAIIKCRFTADNVLLRRLPTALSAPQAPSIATVDMLRMQSSLEARACRQNERTK